ERQLRRQHGSTLDQVPLLRGNIQGLLAEPLEQTEAVAERVGRRQDGLVRAFPRRWLGVLEQLLAKHGGLGCALSLELEDALSVAALGADLGVIQARDAASDGTRRVGVEDQGSFAS